MKTYTERVQSLESAMLICKQQMESIGKTLDKLEYELAQLKSEYAPVTFVLDPAAFDVVPVTFENVVIDYDATDIPITFSID